MNLRQLARDSIFNLGRQTWNIILGLVVSVLLARGLGTEGRGVYAVAVLLPMLIVTFFNLGVGPASVYYIARGEHSLARVVRDNIVLSIATSVIGVVVGLGTIYFAHETLFPGVPSNVLYLSLVLIPVILCRDNLLSVFQGIQDFRSYNLVAFVPQVVTLILALALVWWFDGGVAGALLAVIGGHTSSLLLVLSLLRPLVSLNEPETPPFSRAFARQLLSYGLTVHFSNVVAFFNYRADVFLLNTLASKVSVGLYDVAVTLGERLWILSGAVSTVMFPRIASAQSAEDRRQLTPLVARHVFWLSVAIAAAVYFLAEWSIVLLYGSEYQQAALALRLLLPGIVMESLTKVLANDVAGRGKPGINAVSVGSAAVVNIIANLILIPRFDFAGAALATTLSYTLLALTLALAYCRLAGVNWRELVIPTRTDLLRWERLIRQSIAHLI